MIKDGSSEWMDEKISSDLQTDYNQKILAVDTKLTRYLELNSNHVLVLFSSMSYSVSKNPILVILSILRS